MFCSLVWNHFQHYFICNVCMFEYYVIYSIPQQLLCICINNVVRYECIHLVFFLMEIGLWLTLNWLGESCMVYGYKFTNFEVPWFCSNEKSMFGNHCNYNHIKHLVEITGHKMIRSDEHWTFKIGNVEMNTMTIECRSISQKFFRKVPGDYMSLRIQFGNKSQVNYWNLKSSKWMQTWNHSLNYHIFHFPFHFHSI